MAACSVPIAAQENQIATRPLSIAADEPIYRPQGKGFDGANKGQSSSSESTERKWMLDMRRNAVKSVLVVVKFNWRDGGPTDMKIGNVFYFGSYDRNCSQITSRDTLDQIRKSNLENDLAPDAFERTLLAERFCTDNCGNQDHGVSYVELRDDGLPIDPPRIKFTAPGVPDLIADETSAEKFVSSSGSDKSKKNEAIFGAVSETDDSCVIRILLQEASGNDAHDEGGRTLLMYAVVSKHLNDLRLLLSNGADVNAQDKRGETALMYAVRRGSLEALNLLLDTGANPSIASKSGLTALSIAEEYSNPAIADAIRRAQARQHKVD